MILGSQGGLAHVARFGQPGEGRRAVMTLLSLGIVGGYPAQHPPSWAHPEIVIPAIVALLVLYYAGRFWRQRRDSELEEQRKERWGSPEDEDDGRD